MKPSAVDQSADRPGLRVFLESLACTRRDLDAQKISAYLRENNYTIVHDPSTADIIIVLACGATQEIAKTSFDAIKSLERYKAEIIVAGCLPETHPNEVKNMFSGKTISSKRLEDIEKILPSISTKFNDVPDPHTRWDSQDNRTIKGTIRRIHTKVPTVGKLNWFFLNSFMKIMGKNIHHVAPFNRLIPKPEQSYISISRGCIYNCTYCVIKKGIGPLKSKPPELCIEELKCGLKQGYRSFFLEADDTGPYGIDIQSSLPELLQQIMQIQDEFTVKLSHTHPEWLIKYEAELNEILRQKKVNNILAPIQSGSDRVLHLMNRQYKAEDVKAMIRRFKEAYPDIKIGVDILLGFPSESEDDFQQTLSLFDDVPLDFGAVIPFSCHEGTEASKIEPAVSEQEKKQRIQETLRFLRKRRYFALKIRRTGAIAFYAR